MDVRPLGPPLIPGAATLPNLAPPSTAAATGSQAAPVAALADSVSLFAGLTERDTARLLTILDSSISADADAQIAPLVQAVVQHAQAHDAAQVVAAVRTLAQVAPQAAERLPERDDLAGNAKALVDSALKHATTAARSEAEGQLAAAYHRTPDVDRPASPWEAKPQVVLEVCERLISSGGLINYRKAEALARTVGLEGIVIADIPLPSTAEDGRGLRLRKPSQFDRLPAGVKIFGFVLFVVLVAVWLFWLR